MRSLVVQPETQSAAGSTVTFESAVMTRLAQEQSERSSSSPAKMRWKNLKHQAASSVGDAARAVRDELTNTSSATIDMGTGAGDDDPKEPESTSVVSNTGQPTRSVRRPRRVPNGMGPQLTRRK